jgi:hypothetical protein
LHALAGLATLLDRAIGNILGLIGDGPELVRGFICDSLELVGGLFLDIVGCRA